MFGFIYVWLYFVFTAHKIQPDQNICVKIMPQAHSLGEKSALINCNKLFAVFSQSLNWPASQAEMMIYSLIMTGTEIFVMLSICTML